MDNTQDNDRDDGPEHRAFERSPLYLQWRLDRITRRHGARVRDLPEFRARLLAWLSPLSAHPQASQWREGIRDDFETAISGRMTATQPRYDLAVSRLSSLAMSCRPPMGPNPPRALLEVLASYTAPEGPRADEKDRRSRCERYLREARATIHQAVPVTYDAEAESWIDRIWRALPDRQPARGDVDRLWFYQARHFGDSFSGAQVRMREADALGPNAEPSRGEKLRRALALAAERGCAETSRQIVEIEIPFGKVLFGTRESIAEGDCGELNNFVGKIEETLGGAARLSAADGDRMLVRIPAASLLETLLESARPEKCPRFHYVDGAIPQEEFNDLHGAGEFPIGLTRQALRIKDFHIEVHPFFYTYHDYFHAFMATHLPRSVVAASVQLYRLASRTLPDCPLTRYHLNALLDLDPGVTDDRSMLRFFKKSLNPVNKIMADMQDGIWGGRAQALRDLQRGIRFLETYLRMLRENPAAQPETAAHFAEITTDLERRLGAFQRELEAHRTAGGSENDTGRSSLGVFGVEG